MSLGGPGPQITWFKAKFRWGAESAPPLTNRVITRQWHIHFHIFILHSWHLLFRTGMTTTTWRTTSSWAPCSSCSPSRPSSPSTTRSGCSSDQTTISSISQVTCQSAYVHTAFVSATMSNALKTSPTMNLSSSKVRTQVYHTINGKYMYLSVVYVFE